MTVYNYHKSLAAVLKKPVEDNPVRLQQMLCTIMGYDVEFKYVKGKDLFIADALSRSQPTNQHRSKIEQEIETTRLVHEEQSVTSNFVEIQKPLQRTLSYSLSSTEWAGNQANETFLLKSYCIGTLRMNCPLTMESFTGVIAS